jgi:hypothetical protein
MGIYKQCIQLTYSSRCTKTPMFNGHFSGRLVLRINVTCLAVLHNFFYSLTATTTLSTKPATVSGVIICVGSLFGVCGCDLVVFVLFFTFDFMSVHYFYLDRTFTRKFLRLKIIITLTFLFKLWLCCFIFLNSYRK